MQQWLFFLASFVLSGILNAQQFQVIYPVNGANHINENACVILKKSNGERFSQDELNFRVESDIFPTLCHQARVSIDRKTVNLIPCSEYFLGDHIRVKTNTGIQLCEFTVKTKKTRKSVEAEEKPLALESFRSFPAFVVDTNVTTSTDPIFFRNGGSAGSKYMGIMNSDGSLVWAQAENQVQYFDLQPSGYVSYFDRVADWFLLMDSSYNVVDTIQGGAGLLADFHELVHTPDGNSAIMCEDYYTVDMTSYGGMSNATVVDNHIQLIDASGVIVFYWRAWDHIDVDETVILLTGSNIDYVHVNSIEYDLDSNLVISARNLDQVFLIDRSTGDLGWRLGGAMGNLTFVNDSDGLSLQHDGRIMPNGNLTVFDNGVSHSTPLASVKEYVIDTTLGTATLVWSYEHPYGYPSGRTGNAQRLPNGNTFINWGSREAQVTNPNFTEVNMAGEVVYQFRFTEGDSYTCYRARRHPWDLSVGMTDHNFASPGYQVYPNPAQEQLEIKAPDGMQLDIVKVRDMTGALMSETYNSSIVVIDELPAGTYLVQIICDGKLATKKFVKL